MRFFSPRFESLQAAVPAWQDIAANADALVTSATEEALQTVADDLSAITPDDLHPQVVYDSSGPWVSVPEDEAERAFLHEYGDPLNRQSPAATMRAHANHNERRIDEVFQDALRRRLGEFI